MEFVYLLLLSECSGVWCNPVSILSYCNIGWSSDHSVLLGDLAIQCNAMQHARSQQTLHQFYYRLQHIGNACLQLAWIRGYPISCLSYQVHNTSPQLKHIPVFIMDCGRRLKRNHRKKNLVCQIWQRCVVDMGHPAGGANMAQDWR